MEEDLIEESTFKVEETDRYTQRERARNHLQRQQTKSTGKPKKMQQEGEEVILANGESGNFVNFVNNFFNKKSFTT